MDALNTWGVTIFMTTVEPGRCAFASAPLRTLIIGEMLNPLFGGGGQRLPVASIIAALSAADGWDDPEGGPWARNDGPSPDPLGPVGRESLEALAFLGLDGRIRDVDRRRTIASEAAALLSARGARIGETIDR